MWKVREIADKVTNVVMNYTEVEAKVREATNDDAWGPTGAVMQEIAQATYTFENLPEVMTMLWKRMLQDNRKNWRRTYKSLLLLNYLVRNGSERVVTSSREHIYDLRGLENYTFIDEFGKDQGINIRHKVKELIDFIQDDEKLREERKKAKKNKDKYVGMSSDAMGMRGFGNGEKWRKEEICEWDQDMGGRREPYSESPNNSDDGERYDSDPELQSTTHQNVSKFSTKEYKDSETQETNIIENKLCTPTRKPKSATPSKKIDLGAAANYGKTKSPAESTNKNSGNNNLLDVLGVETAVESNDNFFSSSTTTETQNEFGDFNSAFSNNQNKVSSGEKKEDEFADFSSAFSSVTPVPSVNSPMSLFPQPSSQISSVTNGNSVSSNTDLLSGLNTGTTTTSNSNILLNNPLDDTFPSNQAVGAEEDRRKDSVSVEELGRQLLKLTKEQDFKRIEDFIERIVECLPGPVTPQKVLQIDVTSFSIDNFSNKLYGQILNFVLGKVDEVDWFARSISKIPPQVIRLFACDGANLTMLHESINVLCEALRETQKQTAKLDIVVHLLGKLVESDEIESAFLDFNNQLIERSDDTKAKILFDTKEEMWQECIQLFVSLPNRVANKLGGKVPDLFLSEHFSGILFVHIINCLIYSAKIKSHLGESVELDKISKLLGKTMVGYSRTPSMIKFVEVMDKLCCSQSEEFAETIQEVMGSLDSSCVEVAAVNLLNHCSNSSVMIILNGVLKSDHWSHALLRKIPFLTLSHKESLIRNLVHYLSYVQCGHAESDKLSRVLLDLVTQLLDIWADKSALLHTPLEQHVYITKIIIMGVKFLLKECKVDQSVVMDLQSRLFSGMPTHLESTSETIRAVGMITAECFIKEINSASTNEQAPKLEFEYKNMCQDALVAVNEIRAFSEYDIDTKLSEKQRTSDFDIDSLCESFKKEFSISFNHDSKSEKSSDSEIGKEVGLSTPSQSRAVNLATEVNSDLGSSDDLEPYDLSNDIPLLKAKRPLYLRDLLKNLVEGHDTKKDPDVWIASLEACEELVYKQLPDDDITLGLELLEILLSLDMQFYCENFEELRFAGALAVLVVYPAPSAEFLCKCFHEDNKRFSIAHRLLMLDVIAEGAKLLSSPTKDPVRLAQESMSLQIVIPKKETIKSSPNWEDVVKERINKKTRVFCHPSARMPVGKKNVFASVVGSFFFPLIRGKGETTRGIMFRCDKSTQESPEDSLLLVTRLLHTLAVVMASAVNSHLAQRMGKELLEATWSLRFHDEPKIKEEVIACLASVVLAVPKSLLNSELLNEMVEANSWLEDVANSDVIIGGRSYEENVNCQRFAAQVSFLIRNALSFEKDFV
ncbi:hypothetical protein LSTR_LSTR008465 [Laodelphax striatellus]|uniref:ENTH domain-containing protein n=1 Tax=Laodelphax striatellus TaxID=195883 RepID=A0A482XVB9_LAOST|nr:hypothetical protein LSTR_LSTR008465 [Laodelphax striatellus]